MSPMAGAEIELPPTDADRLRVLNILRGASSRIGLDEAERRMDAALTAQSKADLALLVWDLPDATGSVPSDGVPRPRIGAWRSAAFRAHTMVYGMVNGMLIGVYELTTPHGFFWPFFPIAGWGIGLAGNAFGVRNYQRHQYRKQVRRLERQATKGSRLELSGGRRSAKVTVMFIDMVDSTRLNMVIGDEDWIRVRTRYRELLHDCYRAYHGTEVSSAGDGFLARFDRAGDAVQCAIEAQRRLKNQRDRYGFAPSVRIGINSGEAIEERGDVLGTTVNLASRVTASAEPNEILITEAVADQLDDRFKLTDGGLREMKGLDRTAHVLCVNWS